MKDVRLKKSHSACFQLYDFLEKQNCKDREQISNLQRLWRREGLTTKWKKVTLLSHVQFFATLWTDCNPPGSSVHGIFQARILKWVAFSSSRGSSNPGIKLRSSTWQADSLLSEPPGNPLTIKGMRKFWVVMKFFHISITGVVAKCSSLSKCVGLYSKNSFTNYASVNMTEEKQREVKGEDRIMWHSVTHDIRGLSCNLEWMLSNSGSVQLDMCFLKKLSFMILFASEESWENF